MPLSMGIDPSLTGTGVVLLDANKTGIIGKWLIKTTTKDGDDIKRIVIITKILSGILQVHNPKMVCVEGLSFGSKGSAFAQLASLNFMIRYTCRNGPYEVIPHPKPSRNLSPARATSRSK